VKNRETPEVSLPTKGRKTSEGISLKKVLIKAAKGRLATAGRRKAVTGAGFRNTCRGETAPNNKTIIERSSKNTSSGLVKKTQGRGIKYVN